MTTTVHRLPAGHAMFARYAYPPNELGYCGPADADVLLQSDNPAEIASRAREFDGTWPYLTAVAAAAGIADPLDAEVVRSYWVGGPLLNRVDSAALLTDLRRAFAGQATALLARLDATAAVLAHHSFHVFAVYPWVRFLDRDAITALHVLQQCRIRWGTVQSVIDDHAVVTSQPLTFSGGAVSLGEPAAETVRWRRHDVSLISRPQPGATVAAHWNWLCDYLTESDVAALSAATRTTLDVLNAARKEIGL